MARSSKEDLQRRGPYPIRMRPFVMSGLAAAQDSGGRELLCDVAAELGQGR